MTIDDDTIKRWEEMLNAKPDPYDYMRDVPDIYGEGADDLESSFYRILKSQGLAGPTPGRLLKLGARGAIEGLTTELPRMAGEALEWITPDAIKENIGDPGKALAEWADQKAKDWYGDKPEDLGVIEQAVYEGTKMLAPSLVPTLAVRSGLGIVLGIGNMAREARAVMTAAKTAEELAKGLSIMDEANKAAKLATNIASISTAGFFGLSQAQNTVDNAYDRAEKLEAQGLFEEAEKVRQQAHGLAPWLTGGIEAAGEWLGTKYLSRLFGLEEAEVMKRKGSELLKDFFKTLGVEVSTEMGQQYGEAAVEKYTAIRPEAEPLKEALEVIGPTTVMTMLTGGLGSAYQKALGIQPETRDKDKIIADSNLKQERELAADLKAGADQIDKAVKAEDFDPMDVITGDEEPPVTVLPQEPEPPEGPTPPEGGEAAPVPTEPKIPPGLEPSEELKALTAQAERRDDYDVEIKDIQITPDGEWDVSIKAKGKNAPYLHKNKDLRSNRGGIDREGNKFRAWRLLTNGDMINTPWTEDRDQAQKDGQAIDMGLRSLSIEGVKQLEAKPKPKAEPKKEEGEIVEVRGRKVRIAPDQSVNAVEPGYFPISSTGYRSFVAPPGVDHKTTVEALEKQAKEADSSRNSAMKALAKAKKGTPPSYWSKTERVQPVTQYIHFSTDISVALSHAFFAPEDKQKTILADSLIAYKKLLEMDPTFKGEYGYEGAWTQEELESRLNNIRENIIPAIEEAQKGNWRPLSEVEGTQVSIPERILDQMDGGVPEKEVPPLHAKVRSFVADHPEGEVSNTDMLKMISKELGIDEEAADKELDKLYDEDVLVYRHSGKGQIMWRDKNVPFRPDKEPWKQFGKFGKPRIAANWLNSEKFGTWIKRRQDEIPNWPKEQQEKLLQKHKEIYGFDYEIGTAPDKTIAEDKRREFIVQEEFKRDEWAKTWDELVAREGEKEKPSVPEPEVRTKAPDEREIANFIYEEYKGKEHLLGGKKDLQGLGKIQKTIQNFFKGDFDAVVQDSTIRSAGNNPYYAKPFEHFTGLKLPTEIKTKTQDSEFRQQMVSRLKEIKGRTPILKERRKGKVSDNVTMGTWLGRKRADGIRFGKWAEELKEMPKAIKMLSRSDKSGRGLEFDNFVREAIERGYFPKGTTDAQVLEQMRTNPRILSMKPQYVDHGETPEHRKTKEEKAFEEELEKYDTADRTPWPEGKYVTMFAGDLPEGVKLTLIEGKTWDGWDIYTVEQPDGPFGGKTILRDGETLELNAGEKVSILASDYKKHVLDKLGEMPEPKEPETDSSGTPLYQPVELPEDFPKSGMYYNKVGKIVTVDEYGGEFSFYAKSPDKMKSKGTRVKGRGRSFRYKSKNQAEEALHSYAYENKFKPAYIEFGSQKPITRGEATEKKIVEPVMPQDKKNLLKMSMRQLRMIAEPLRASGTTKESLVDSILWHREMSDKAHREVTLDTEVISPDGTYWDRSEEKVVEKDGMRATYYALYNKDGSFKAWKTESEIDRIRKAKGEDILTLDGGTYGNQTGMTTKAQKTEQQSLGLFVEDKTQPGLFKLSEKKREPTHGVNYKSGASRINDMKGYIDAGEPFGVNVQELSEPAMETLIEHAKNGGHVFVDNGAYQDYKAKRPTPFKEVFERYDRIVNESGGNVTLVGPDILGNQRGTLDLVQHYAEKIRDYINKGVDVIIPMQKGEYSPYDLWMEMGRRIGHMGFRLGIPMNEVRYTDDDFRDLFQKAPTFSPNKIHFLGMSPRNRAFKSKYGLLKKLATDRLDFTSDATRLLSLARAGKPLTMAQKSEQDAMKVWDNEGVEAVVTEWLYGDLTRWAESLDLDETELYQELGDATWTKEFAEDAVKFFDLESEMVDTLINTDNSLNALYVRLAQDFYDSEIGLTEEQKGKARRTAVAQTAKEGPYEPEEELTIEVDTEKTPDRTSGLGGHAAGSEPTGVGTVRGTGDERTELRSVRPRIRVARPEVLPEARDEISNEQFGIIDKHQRQAVNLALGAFKEGKKGFMLADGTGVGKTMQELIIAHEMNKRTGKPSLIITENKTIIQGNFRPDASKLGITLEGVELGTYHDLRAGKIGKQGYGVVIFDESHNLKNANAQKTQAAEEIQSDHKVFATATPMDKPIGAAYFISEILGRPREEIERQLGFEWREVPITGTNRTKIQPVPLPGHDWSMVFDNILSMRDEAASNGQLIRREYPFYGEIGHAGKTLSADQAMMEGQILSYWEERIQSAWNPKIKMRLSGQRTLEMGRWLESEKIDWAHEMVKSEMAKGRHVIVVAEGINETEIKGLGTMVPGFLGELSSRLEAEGIDHAKIYGTGKKGNEVARFQNNQVQLALMTPKSGGAGINLDDSVGDRPRTMLVITPNFAGDVFQQILGRVSRRNTKSPAQVYFTFYTDAFSDNKRIAAATKKIRTLQAIQSGEDLDVAYGLNLDGETIAEPASPYRVKGWEALSLKQKKAIDRHLRGKPNGAEIKTRMNKLRGTDWERQVVVELVTERAIMDLIDGKDPSFESLMDTKYGPNLKDYIRRWGFEGIWRYVEDSKDGVVGHAAKPVNAINGAYYECDPTPDCATYCYATEGNYRYPAPFIKGILNHLIIENDPIRAAKIANRYYQGTLEGELGKALRFFDKGDGTNAYAELLKELNRMGVTGQIFSRKPGFLRLITDKNPRLLSIDSQNRFKAEQNPDLPIAFIYGGGDEVDLRWLDSQRSRFEQYGGVILPVRQGRKLLSKAEVDKLPKWARKYCCPIDSGVVKIKSKNNPEGWTCTQCDKNMGIGCFYKRVTAKIVHVEQTPITERTDIDEYADEIRKFAETLEPAKRDFLLGRVDLIVSKVRSGIDPATEEDREGKIKEDIGRETTYEVREPAVLTFQQTQTIPAEEPRNRIRMATTGRIAAEANVVLSLEDATALLSPIRKSAQEFLYTVTTNENGIVLEVHKYIKGIGGKAYVSPTELMGRVLNIPDAKYVYAVHNHPTGSLTPSVEDSALSTKLNDLARLKDIGFQSAIIAGTKYASVEGMSTPMDIRPTVKRTSLPVKERMIRRPAGEFQIFNTPAAIVYKDQNYGDQEGFLMLTRRGQPVGFAPYTPGPANEIAADLISQLEAQGASRVIFFSNEPIDKKTTGQRSRRSFLEVLSSATKFDIDLLDVVEQGKALFQEGKGISAPEGLRFGHLGKTPVYAIGKSVPVVGDQSVLDILRKSPPLRDLTMGLSNDGTVWVKLPGNKGFIVKSVKVIDADRVAIEVGHGEMLEDGKIPLGKYLDGVIELQRDMADEWTVTHETIHMAEDLGFLNEKDIEVLRNKIIEEQAAGRWNSKKREVGGQEDRAVYGTKFMRDRTITGPVQKVLQKIADFVDAIVNIFKRTARGVLRDIESGKIFKEQNKGGMLGNRIPSYETAAARWYSQLVNAITDKLPGAGSAKQFQTTLDSWAHKNIIKEHELFWSGLQDWLAEKEGKVTKQEVLDYLETNHIRLEEKILGGDKTYDDLVGDRIQEGNIQWSEPGFIEPKRAWLESEVQYYQDDDIYPDYSEDELYERAYEAWQEFGEAFEAYENESEWTVRFDAAGENYSILDADGNFVEEVQFPAGAQTPAGRLAYAKERVFDILIERNLAVTEDELMDLEDQLEARYEGERYNRPGGKDYRELVLILPQRTIFATSKELNQYFEEWLKANDYPDIGAERLLKELKQQGDRLAEASGTGENFLSLRDYLPVNKYSIDKDIAWLEKFIGKWMGQGKSKVGIGKFPHQRGHFYEDNVLVHIRFDTRNHETYGKILHIAEVQSDWHQKGRKHGYDTPEGRVELAKRREKKIAPYREKLDKLMNELDLLNMNLIQMGYMGKDNSWIPANTDEFKKAQEEMSKLRSEINRIEATIRVIKLEYSEGQMVPDAPFSSTQQWVRLAMKRMVRYAAENGYDAISWDPGFVHVDRYTHALRALVEKITWYKNSQGEDVVAAGKGMTQVAVLPHEGGIIKDNAYPKEFAGKTIEAVFGKNIAEKVLGSEGGSVEGDELTVGGEEFKEFYDSIMVKGMNNFFGKKAWGKARVIRTAIGEASPKFQYYRIEEMTQSERGRAADALMRDAMSRAYWESQPAFRQNMRGYARMIENGDITNEELEVLAQSYHELENYITKDVEVPQMRVQLLQMTPEMKSRAIGEGMPLFSISSIKDTIRNFGRSKHGSSDALDDVLPEHVQPRYKGARGFSRDAVYDRLNNHLRSAVLTMAPGRQFTNMPPKYFGKAIEALRHAISIPQWSKWRAAKEVANILAPDKMKPADYDLFSAKLILEDMIKDMDSQDGPLSRWEELVDKHGDMAFGFKSRQEVEDALERLDTKIADNRIVNDALERRELFMTDLRKRLVEEKLLPDSVLDDDRYWHHQVLEFANLKYSVGIGMRDIRVKKHGYQIHRIGSVKDYNTHYIESEYEVVAQALAQLEMKKVRAEFDDGYNIIRELRQQAKHENYVKIVGGQENYERLQELRNQKAYLVGDGQGLDSQTRAAIKELTDEIWSLDPTMEYRVLIARGMKGLDLDLSMDVLEIEDEDFDFREIKRLADEGNEHALLVFKGISGRNKFIKDTLGRSYITWHDKMVERDPMDGSEAWVEWLPQPGSAWFMTNSINDRILEEYFAGNRDIVKEDVRQVMARGVDERWVIPAELAEALNGEHFVNITKDNPIAQTAEKTLNWWKRWILINPMRIVKYNLNNLSGDFDIAFAYDPKIAFKYGWQAAKDMWKFHYNKEMTPELEKELDFAVRTEVIGSGMTVHDIPDIGKTPQIRRLMEAMSADKPSKLRLIERFWEGSKNFTTWRENVLRLAALRYFKDRIAAGDNVYGASNKDKVDATTDPDRRAALLARELIGDYGGLSKGGQWLRRKAIPFYSWMEINAPRYVRMYRNLAVEGEPRGRRARTGAVLGKKATLLTAKVTMLYAMVTMFNNIFWPDEEEELGEYQRRQLHLILGRRPDGSIVTVRFQGALSDALSWFNLHDFPNDMEDLATGKTTIYKWLGEGAVEPVNKLIQGLRPDVKVPLEVLSRRTFYPEFWRPRLVRDRWEHVARMFSLEPLYRHAVGKPIRGDSIAARVMNDIASVFTYTADPGESAYNDTRALVNEFLRDNNLEKPTEDPTSRSNALYYYKQAIKFGNGEAAEKYLRKYKELGGKIKYLKISVDRAHPLAMLPRRFRTKFFNRLSQKDRDMVKRATDWYKETYKGR